MENFELREKFKKPFDDLRSAGIIPPYDESLIDDNWERFMSLEERGLTADSYFALDNIMRLVVHGGGLEDLALDYLIQSPKPPEPNVEAYFVRALEDFFENSSGELMGEQIEFQWTQKNSDWVPASFVWDNQRWHFRFPINAAPEYQLAEILNGILAQSKVEKRYFQVHPVDSMAHGGFIFVTPMAVKSARDAKVLGFYP